METINCPRCHDDVQEKAFSIHVNETCIAIGKSPEEVKAIQEANDLPFSVVATLAEQQADLTTDGDSDY